MEICETSRPDAIASLQGEWRDLVERSPDATIYQTWEWNDAWWTAFGRGKRLKLLEAREGELLVGIAPLYSSRHLNTPLRRLAIIGTGAADYLDFIAAESCQKDVCAAFLSRLRSLPEYDICDLQHLRPGGAIRKTLECQPSPIGASGLARLPAQEECPFVPLPESWGEYTARLGKKSRSNLGYYERLLERTFPSAKMELAASDRLDELLDALFDLHQRRWNARLLPGVLASEKVRRFHREVAERFQERGWLRLHTLAVDGRVCAALYCFRFRERYYYYLGGFDPSMGKFSIGTTLTAAAMRQAIEEGCAEFDFLRGNEPYKFRWLPEVRMNHRLLMSQNRGVRSRMMLALHRLERRVERRAKQFAEQRGRKGP